MVSRSGPRTEPVHRPALARHPQLRPRLKERSEDDLAVRLERSKRGLLLPIDRANPDRLQRRAREEGRIHLDPRLAQIQRHQPRMTAEWTEVGDLVAVAEAEGVQPRQRRQGGERDEGITRGEVEALQIRTVGNGREIREGATGRKSQPGQRGQAGEGAPKVAPVPPTRESLSHRSSCGLQLGQLGQSFYYLPIPDRSRA